MLCCPIREVEPRDEMGRTRDGRRRAVIEDVTPRVDDGRFPAKRNVGDVVVVEADLFADGHDEIGAVLRYRHEDADAWEEVGMHLVDNDRWRASFPVTRLGTYVFAPVAWIDAFASWHRAFVARREAGQDLRVELKVGARLVARVARKARADSAVSPAETGTLDRIATTMRGRRRDDAIAAALDPALPRLMQAHGERPHATELSPPLRILVERERARSGAWYELFPRSASTESGRHGTIDDVIDRLPEVARMGFDVLYLPPIHPIGRTNRKGRNNTPAAESGDVGSPWAIGSQEGGHTAVHPGLGTIDDVDRLVKEAAGHDLEIALDLAFQCSPDHPWVREHPEWFTRLPGGSIRFAENPPKRYEDIYPLNFDSPAWRELWSALRAVIEHWIDHGIRVFRVDNPHTKPFAFWDWLLGEVRAQHPDVVFLSEAFTRPKVMYWLAKLGFSQSYTYFTWRRTKDELTDYFRELATPPVCEFFRPNAWPNTPDILPAELQSGDEGAAAIRLVLAATLSASYGIYGPAFESLEHEPRESGAEEYRNSEKYELRTWDADREIPLRGLIARVNAIRHDHGAFQRNDMLRFHAIDNPQLLAYSKSDPSSGDVVLVIVNLDHRWPQSGWIDVEPGVLGITRERFAVRELLTDATFEWVGSRNYVELRPGLWPAHILVPASARGVMP
jgi:starch synthase (maltosyl-transferring)